MRPNQTALALCAAMALTVAGCQRSQTTQETHEVITESGSGFETQPTSKALSGVSPEKKEEVKAAPGLRTTARTEEKEDKEFPEIAPVAHHKEKTGDFGSIAQ